MPNDVPSANVCPECGAAPLEIQLERRPGVEPSGLSESAWSAGAASIPDGGMIVEGIGAVIDGLSAVAGLFDDTPNPEDEPKVLYCRACGYWRPLDPTQ